MKTNRIILAFVGLALASTACLEATTNTIYFDPFTASTGSALNGSAPKDHGGIGTDTWLAPDDGMALDGGALTITSGSRWASLPFSPVEGNKYKISMDMNATHTGSDWFAIGFCDTPTPVADYGAQHLCGWYLIRGLNPGYPLHSFTGYATDGGGQAGNFTGPHKIAVILDTTLDNWTFEFLVDDISQRGPVAFSTTPSLNPSIANVTFGSYGTARGIMDNFKLENIFQVPIGAPTIATQPKSSTVVLGSTVKLEVLAAGPKPITYQWYKNNQELSGEIGSTLTVANLAVADSGAKYTVKVTNSYGTTTSDAATLTVLNVAGPLIHKFNFNDGNANDAVGGMTGAMKGTTAIKAGQLACDGSDNGFVLLSDYAMPPAGSASVVAWFRASSSIGKSARVFDFGSGTLNYFYFTPMTDTGGSARFGFKAGTDAETSVSYTPALNDDLDHMVAAVIDSTPTDTGANGTMLLYIDGKLVGTNDLNGTLLLANLDFGPQNYIGKSQWVNTGDLPFKGYIDEVRVYNTALSQTAIAALTPDPDPATAPDIDTQPIDTVAALGDSVNLVVGVTGSKPMTFQWRLNGANIAGSNTNPLTLASVKTADFGAYDVVVSNSMGSVTSLVAHVSLSRWSFEAWNDDASSGVDTAYAYTHAFNLGASSNTEINGQAFRGVGGGNPSVASSFSITGVGNVFGNDANNIPDGSGSRTLANDFIYGGTPGTLTLYGLTPGKDYVLTLFSVGWESPGNRWITFGAAGGQNKLVDQDAFDNNNGIRISYQYTADTNGSVTITTTPKVAASSHHMYGFCNRSSTKIPTGVVPTITSQPQSTSTALDSSAGFAVTATGTPPLSYQWRFNGAAIAGATGSTYTIDNVQTANFGNYAVVVSNTSGSVTSIVAQLVLSRWYYQAWTDDATSGVDTNYYYSHAYNFGSTTNTEINGLTFTGVSGGNPGVLNSFVITGMGNVFNNDANNLADGTGSRTLANDFIYGGNPGTLTLYGLVPGKDYLLTLFSVAFETAGNRRITFSAAGGQQLVIDQDFYDLDNGILINFPYTADASGTVSITNAPIVSGSTHHSYGFCNRLANKVGTSVPPEIMAQPQDTSAAVGAPASFAVRAIGPAPLNYQWRLNNANITGANASAYSIDATQTASFGNYVVVVSNTYGSVTSVVAQLSLLRFSATNWTDDASSGVDSKYVYTHAYNFGSANGTTINGVKFTGIAGGDPAISNVFSLTGVPNVYNNDGNNIPAGSGSKTIATDFIYGGNPGTLTLYGLTPGKQYLLTLYSMGWEDSGRMIQFVSAKGQSLTVDQDTYQNNNGIRILYEYTADANGSVTVSSYQAGAAGTFHTYGFSNRELAAAATLPQLTITAQAGSVTLSWPASYTGFVLESTTSLLTPSWSAVNGVQNNQMTVVHSKTGNQFFRLRKP